MLIKEDGSLWVAGSNEYGRLGLGEEVDEVRKFTKLQGFSDVRTAAAGTTHSLIIKEDGTLWAAGENYYGELGLGHNSNKNVFTKVEEFSDVQEVAVGSNHTLFIDGGTLWITGHNNHGQLGLGIDALRIFSPEEIVF